MRENVPIRILVTNFSKRYVTLPKNALTAVHAEKPERIIPYHELASSSTKEVRTVYYIKSEDRCTQIGRHQQLAPEDKKRKTHNWRQKIEIDDIYQEYRDKFVIMMEEFGTM